MQDRKSLNSVSYSRYYAYITYYNVQGPGAITLRDFQVGLDTKVANQSYMYCFINYLDFLGIFWKCVFTVINIIKSIWPESKLLRTTLVSIKCVLHEIQMVKM
jgi:hypothetical protein